jgi:hypothetical protein
LTVAVVFVTKIARGAFAEPSLPARSGRDLLIFDKLTRVQSASICFCLIGVIVCVAGVGLSSISTAAVKKVAYSEVKVTVNKFYQPDAAFEKMREAFGNAVAKKDVDALSALIAPTFLWTLQGQPADELDLGRDAIHNFKVVFGFRALGKDEDGGVDNGPYWDALAAFAGDLTYYAATDTGNLICGPIAADVVDDNIFEQASKRIGTGDKRADWYFTLTNVDVAKTPGDTGAPVAKVGTIALPMLSSFPAAKEGQPQPTDVEVLLPSGKSGWIRAAAVRPLFTERLCYAKTPSGDWKIAALDQPG